MQKKNNFNWRLLTTNRRYLLFSIGAILIAAMIIFYGILPQISQANDLYKEIESKQKRLLLLQRKAADLDNIEAHEAFSSKEAVDKVLPSTKPLIELLTALDSVAQSNNIQFVDFSLTPGEISSKSAEFLDSAKFSAGKNSSINKSNAGYKTLPVELTIKGEFRNVQNFFIAIEKVAPLITIASISLDIKSAGNLDETELVEADLLLKTHYFTKSLSVALESPLPKISENELAIVDDINNYIFPTVTDQQRIIGGGAEDLFGYSFEELTNQTN